MASKAFSETLSLLASEKLKDRTQGLEDVRLFLSLPRNIEWMNRDKKQWLRFLQTIFQIVVDEQRAYVSKSTAPALKRLKDAAQAVRMIIEKAAADIPRKAFKAVFSHILSIIVVQAKLFEPIALEYLKALRACVAFPPHLDHLDVKLWNHAVSTCFSAVLGDTIKGYELVDDHAMDVDDDDEDRSSNATQRSKKRKVNGTFRLAPTDSENFSFSQTGYTYSASQNTIELCSCIEALFKSSQAPLVSKGGVLLSKFTRFFRSFPHETTAHQSMLAALNRLLNDLEFNNKSLLEKAVSHLWPPMVALWNTKSNALKEQLVMATTLLLPYTLLLEGCSLANSLYNATLTEIENRWGAQPLDLDSLAFNCSAPGQDNLPHHGFSTRLFHAGSTFDFQQVLSWTILNLSAACFIPCDKFTSEIGTGSSISSPAPKRARVDQSIDIFQQLLSDLKNQNERGIQHRLQLVIFICELDSRAVTASRMQLLQASVVALLSHSSGTIQTWAMICLASLATSQSLSALRQRKAPVYDRDYWSMVWERCLKAFHQPSTSRAACFLLLTISSLHMIDERTRTTDLIAIGADIEIQGPPYPTDAACALLLQIVKIAESDVRTYRLDLANKICNRITNNWQWRPAMIRPSRLFNPKGRTEPLSPMSYFDLLTAISYGSSQANQTARQDTVLADSALTNFWNTRHALRSMRAWFWDASLPRSVEGKHSEAEEAVLDPPEATTNPVALKILAHLRKGLEGLADQLEDADDLYWQGLNLESFRNMLDLAWISIAFDAYADLRQVIRSERISAQSLRLLDALMPKIQHSKWSLPEKAALLTALSPMFFQIQDAPVQSEVLICAGLSSGVRISSITSGEGKRQTSPVCLPITQRIWAAEGIAECFVKHSSLFKQILSAGSAEPHHARGADEDADFGPIRVTTSTQMTGRAMLHPESKLATDRCLNVAVRALVTSAYFEENNGKPVRLRSLVKGLLEDTGVHFILLTHHLLDAFRSEYFTFAGNELEAIIEKIGTELLPSYEYSRNVDLQLLVIKFLQATVHQWGRDEAIELPYADKARKLAAWFAEQLLARNLPVWQVRTACIDMLKAFIVSKHLTAFGQGSEPLATWDGQELQPDEVLIRVLDDVDFRVRFRLAPVIGRICSRIHEDGRQAFSVWTSILKMKSFDLADMQFESNITTLLTYSNVMVASDFFRSNAYHPIITLAALDGSRTMSRYIRSALSATAGRLGLDSLADLYSFLAPYTMAEQLYNGQERLLIPDPTAFGFVNKQSLYAVRFNETAPMILAGPRPEFFQDMCAYAGLEEKQATLLCFPTYVAYKFTAGEPGSEVFKLAEQEIAFKAVDIAPDIGQQAPDLLRSIRDLVIWRLFTFIWEAEYSRDSLVSIVTTCWTHEPLATAALQEMLSQVSEPFRPNVLSPPDVRLSSVLGSLKRSHPAIAGGLEDEAIVYSVLQRMLCSVARPPFVSQQMRLLYNTAICMACARSVVIRSLPIIELLCTRLSVLLAQEDLFQLGGSLFLWTVRQLALLRRRDKSELQTEFHSILQAAEAAHRLAEEAASSTHTTYADASQFLKDLETCIFENGSETELRTLSSFKSLRLLWPRSTGIESTAPSLLDFEQALKAAKGQQGIVNVIQAMAKMNSTSMSHKHQDKLAQILWLALSQCDATAVRKTNPPSFNEAFAKLLQATCGRVAPPAIETMVNYTNFTETSETSAKLQIIAHLAGLLDSPDLEESNAAFEALVTIASTRSIDWLSLRDQRLEMLARPQLHRQSIQTQDRDPEVSPELRDLVQNSYWLELAQSQTAWQRGITAFIARALGSNDSFYRPLGPLLASNATLGRKCLPGLIEAILLVDKAESTRQIISTYLEKILDSASPSSADVVDLVIHLRTRLPPEGYAGLQSASLSDLWLSIPYSKLARSALAAGQPYAAMLCVELARDQGNDLSSVPKEVLYKIYNDIKEPDNFYSIASADLPSGLIRRLHHEGRWLEALSWHGAELEASSARSPATAALENIIQTLSQGDLSRTAMALLQTRGATYTLPEGVLSSLAWKTQSWDIPILQKPAPGSSSAIFDALRTTGKAHSMSHQDPASNANMGRQLAELAKLDLRSPLASTDLINNILGIQEVLLWQKDYQSRLSSYYSDSDDLWQNFSHDAAELILRIRSTLLAHMREVESRRRIDDEVSEQAQAARGAERKILLNLSRLAQTGGQQQAALNAVLKCQNLADPSDHEVAIAFASVLWLSHESDAALRTLGSLLSTSAQSMGPEAHAEVLAVMGTWTATSRRENATVIREEYFERSWNLVASLDSKNKADVAIRYARFADDQYQQTSSRVSEIDQLESYTRKKEGELAQLVNQTKNSQSSSSELRGRRRADEAMSQQDRQVISNFRSARRSLLESAVTMYSHALAHSDGNADAIYRLCSLWLSNFEDDGFCANARKAITSIPSHCFIPLVPQLSARLAALNGEDKSPFQRTLQTVVEHLAVEHPFHSLFQLYFLYNTGAGTNSQPKATQKRRSSGNYTTNGLISEMLSRLRQTSSLRETMLSIEQAIAAYAEWAGMKVEKQRPSADRMRPMPKTLKLLTLKHMRIPVSTVSIPVDKTCTYKADEMPCIVGYKKTYTTAGGINLPKITDCVGSDGKTYRQLFKGGDDVRQDAVMQQIFGVTNDLLNNDDRAHLRKLNVRTYKVIPISHDCGLLEFVSDSQAIGEWLVPAHAKYRPNDLPIPEARKAMADKQRESDEERVELYKKIMKHVHPVMRHFFMEKHHLPYWWFQMRLNYSRSAATMSMVGYVMGIGDRHVSNIMIDTARGELVPIDFGIAFEAGKQLPTPEYVPFRLTPDIVDGFGVSGVEGVFRKCSEETIRVLRNKSSVLMTILDVFRYDPLQKWTATAAKVRRIQGSQLYDRKEETSRTEELTDAERAIRTVSEKLRSDLSVVYTVNDLIMQAQDVSKLGAIFFGWQPYL